jgi:hypothetical protein
MSVCSCIPGRNRNFGKEQHLVLLALCSAENHYDPISPYCLPVLFSRSTSQVTVLPSESLWFEECTNRTSLHKSPQFILTGISAFLSTLTPMTRHERRVSHTRSTYWNWHQELYNLQRIGQWHFTVWTHFHPLFLIHMSLKLVICIN